MYYAEQTLFDKETGQLVALVPSSKNNSMWAWDISHVVNEKGEKIALPKGRPYWERFVPIANSKGQIQAGADRSKNKFVDISLKRYIKKYQSLIKKA